MTGRDVPVVPTTGIAPTGPPVGAGSLPGAPANWGRGTGAPGTVTGRQAIAAAMSEAELEEQVRDTCKKLGILRFHVRVMKGTTAGLPDDILIGPRGVLWRELKNQTYKPTRAQVKTGEALTKIGQDFAIWRPEDWFSQRIARELAAISKLRRAA